MDANDFLQDFEDLLANDDDHLECKTINEPFILEHVYSYLKEVFALLQLLPPRSGQLIAACQEEEDTDEPPLLTKDMFDQFI